MVKLFVGMAMIFSSTVLMVSCDSPTSPRTDTNYIDGNTYHSGDAKMQLSVPDGWKMITDTTISLLTFRLIGYKPTSSNFRPNFNLAWEEHSGPSDMSQILDYVESMILSTYLNAAMISKQTVQLDGSSVGECVFGFSMNNVKLICKQLYVIHNDKDIVMTLACAASDYSSDSLDLAAIEHSITFQ